MIYVLNQVTKMVVIRVLRWTRFYVRKSLKRSKITVKMLLKN